MKKCYFLLVLCLFFPFLVEAVELTNVYKIYPTEKCYLEVSDNIKVSQGAYFFNRNGTDYVVYAGYTGDESESILTLVDLNHGCIVKDTKSKLLGHANDITYNSKDDYFYVTTYVSGSMADYKKIVKFKITNDLKIDISSNDEIPNISASAGLTYDKYEDILYVYAGGTLKSFKIIDSTASVINKTLKENIPTYYNKIIFNNGEEKYYIYDPNDETAPGYALFVNQGISQNVKNIYFPRALQGSKSSGSITDSERWLASAYSDTADGIEKGQDKDSAYVNVFKKNGDYRYSLFIPNKTKDENGFTGHLEDCTVIGNRILLIYNDHYSNPKRVYFFEYTGINQYEDDFYDVTVNDYVVDSTNNIISRIDLTSKESFLNDVVSNGVDSEIYNGTAVISGSSILGTGNVLTLRYSKDNSDIKPYVLSVLGDIDGNGKINKSDVTNLSRKVINQESLEDIYKLAGDINNDNLLKVNDIMNLLNNISE